MKFIFLISISLDNVHTFDYYLALPEQFSMSSYWIDRFPHEMKPGLNSIAEAYVEMLKGVRLVKGEEYERYQAAYDAAFEKAKLYLLLR